MKLILFAGSFLLMTSIAGGVVVTLGPSRQAVIFTGTGVNASGAGTAQDLLGFLRLRWDDLDLYSVRHLYRSGQRRHL